MSKLIALTIKKCYTENRVRYMKNNKIIVLCFIILFMITLEVKAMPSVSAPYYVKEVDGEDKDSDFVSEKYRYYADILEDYTARGETYVKDEDLYNIDINIENNKNNNKQYNLVVTANPASGPWKEGDLKLLYDQTKNNKAIEFKVSIYDSYYQYTDMIEKTGDKGKKKDKDITVDAIQFFSNNTLKKSGTIKMWVEKQGNKYVWKTTDFVAKNLDCSANGGICQIAVSVDLVEGTDPTVMKRSDNTVKRSYEAFLDQAYLNYYNDVDDLKIAPCGYYSDEPINFQLSCCASYNEVLSYNSFGQTVGKNNIFFYASKVNPNIRTSLYNCKRESVKVKVPYDNKYGEPAGYCYCQDEINNYNNDYYNDYYYDNEYPIANNNFDIMDYITGRTRREYYQYRKIGVDEDEDGFRENNDEYREKILKRFRFKMIYSLYADFANQDVVENAKEVDWWYNPLVKNPYKWVCDFLHGSAINTKTTNNSQKLFITYLKNKFGSNYNSLIINNNISLSNNKLLLNIDENPTFDLSLNNFRAEYQNLIGDYCTYIPGNEISAEMNNKLDIKKEDCQEEGKCIQRMRYPQKEDKFLDYIANAIHILYISKFENSDFGGNRTEGYNNEANIRADTKEDEIVTNEDGKRIDEVFNSWKQKAIKYGEVYSDTGGVISGGVTSKKYNTNDINKSACYSKILDSRSNYGIDANGNKNRFIVKQTKAGNGNNIFTYNHAASTKASSKYNFLNEAYYYYEETNYTQYSVKYQFNTIDVKENKGNYTSVPKSSKTVEASKQTVCSRKCAEAVKVAYYPPQIVKAGMCFEYKVKITSYTRCEVAFDNKIGVLQNFPTCKDANGNIRPNCNDIYLVSEPKPNTIHADNIVSQGAGPNNIFENCINECDGGKYSAECSKQCYSKTYGSNIESKNMSSNDFNVAVSKLAGKSIVREDTNNAIKTTQPKPNGALKECLNYNPEGCFYKTSNGYHWYSSSARNNWMSNDFTAAKGKYKVDFGYYKYLLKFANSHNRQLIYPINDPKYNTQNLVYESIMLINRYDLLKFKYINSMRVPFFTAIYNDKKNADTLKEQLVATIPAYGNYYPTIMDMDLDTYIKKYFWRAAHNFSLNDYDDGIFKAQTFVYPEDKDFPKMKASQSCSAVTWYAEPLGLGDYYVNPYMYQVDLANNMSLLHNEASKCTAKSVCSVTSTTYTMGTGVKINKTTSDGKASEKSITIQYPYTELSSKSCTSNEKGSIKCDANSKTKCSNQDLLCSTNTVENNGAYANYCRDTNTTALNNNSIIRRLGGCYYYNSGDSLNNLVTSTGKIGSRYYHTTLSLQGVWRSTKGGSYQYTCKPGPEYIFLKDNFCIDTSSSPVNGNFYNKIIQTAEDYNICSNTCKQDYLSLLLTEQPKLEDVENSYNKPTLDGYNIKTSIHSFGKYKWNFDIYCFYATEGKGKDSTTSQANTNDCTCGKQNKISIQESDEAIQFNSSSIAQDGISNANNIEVKDISEVEKGYNWKSYGELLTDSKSGKIYSDEEAQLILERKNPNYSKNPKDIISTREEKAKTGQIYNITNADYVIRLTPTGIATLKKYLKESNISGKYDLFKDGTLKNINGILTYESKIGDKTGVNITRNTKIGKNT